jgi:hypothetical protein
VRRASAGLTPVRAGAALAMLLSAAAIYGVAASPAFGISQVEVNGNHWTSEAAILERLGVARGANLFGLRTDPLEARLRELPTVADVRVGVGLPDRLVVDVVEREAILAWKVGAHRYLVDRDGTLFAEPPTPAPADGANLPVVDDRRADSAGLVVGGRIDPVDLDAATRLGSVRPADVGSTASGLRISATDESGFVMRPSSGGWSAVFGFYTPSLRTTDMIAGQVRLLRSLLLRQGEANVAQIVLASETDGTFSTPRPSTKPSGTP